MQQLPSPRAYNRAQGFLSLITVNEYHNFISNVNATIHASIQRYGRKGLVPDNKFETGHSATVWFRLSAYHPEQRPLTWDLLYEVLNYIYDAALASAIRGQIPLLEVTVFESVGNLYLVAGGLVGRFGTPGGENDNAAEGEEIE